MITRSIRWQIQAWHAMLLCCVTAGLLVAFYLFEHRDRMRALDARHQQMLLVLLPTLQRPGGGPPPPLAYGGGNRPQRERRPHERVGTAQIARLVEEGVAYVHWDPEGQVLGRSDNAVVEQMRADMRLAGGTTSLRTVGGLRQLVHAMPREQTLIIGSSLAGLHAEMRVLGWRLAALGASIILIGCAGGWWLASRAIRPIAQISNTAGRIANGDLTLRIDVHHTESELGQLADVLNHTFARLNDSIEQQVRFTADASHELRTPLAAMQAEIEHSLSRPRDAESYKEALMVCQRAVSRMNQLVNGLLELARADAGEMRILRSQCDLAEIAAEAVSFLGPLAEQRQTAVDSRLQAVMVEVDEEKIFQVITNLIANALHHNPLGTPVCVTVTQEGAQAVLAVIDQGNGIASDALPQLFERFHRLDKARSRKASNTGTGLGLAISKAIVHAHGGTIQVTSEEHRGSIFRVTLPALVGVAVAPVV